MKINLFIILLLGGAFGKAQQTNAVLDSLVSHSIKEYDFPAISVSLITSDTVYYGIGGTTKYNGGKKVFLQSKFHLGSNTKAITAFIAMKMEDENIIKFSTKLIDVFPEFKSVIRKEYLNITLSDLLSHKAFIQPFTSGLEYTKLPVLKGSVSQKRYNFAKYTLQQNPVEKGTYSNAGYVIASLMLEKKSGLSFEKLLKKYLSELKLNYFIGFPNKESENNPAGHSKKDGKWIVYSPNHPYKLFDYTLPAGDVSMDIINYSIFIQKNLTGLKKGNLLSKKNYQRLHFKYDGYSYGWANFNGKKISAHNGSAGIYFCHTILIPDKDIAVIVMTNSISEEQQKHIVLLREDIIKNLKRIKNEI